MMKSATAIGKGRAWCRFLTALLLTVSESSGTSNTPSVTPLVGYEAEYGVKLPTTYLAPYPSEIADVTPDGRHVLVAPRGWHKAFVNPLLGGNRHVEDHTVYVWSTSSGKIATRFKGHRERITGVKVAPTGERVLSGSIDGRIFYWELRTGRILRELEGYREEKLSIAFAANREVAAVAALEQQLKVWDLASGETLYSSSEARMWGDPVALSPDADRLAWASEDGKVHIVNMASKREAMLLEVGGIAAEGTIRGLCFSPDGTRLAVADMREARVYDMSSGQIVARLRHPYETDFSSVEEVAFSADAKWLITAGDHRQIFLWDLETGRIAAELAVAGPSVLDVEVTTDGTSVVAMQGNSWDVYRWTISDLSPPPRRDTTILAEFAQPGLVASSLTFTPDGKMLAAVVSIPQNSRGKIVFWSTDTWQIVKELPSLAASQVLTFSPDGNEFVTSDDNQVYIRLLDTGGYLSVAAEPNLTRTPRIDYRATSTVTCATFYNPQVVFYPSRHGPAAFARDGDISCRLWDLKSMTALTDYTLDKFASVHITPDFRHFLTRTNRSTILLRETTTGNEIGRISNVVGYTIAVSPDSSRFLACQEHGYEFALYDMAAKQKVSAFRVECASVQGPVVMLNSDRGLVTHEDLQIRLWDFVRGKELHSFYSHSSRITGLAVSPDRKVAASVDALGGILVWEIPQE